MKSVIFACVISLIFAACKSDEKTNEANPHKLKEYFTHAVLGDSSANKLLSFPFEVITPECAEYNSIQSDSLELNGNTYYYILAQYSNPIYNRFAVYDSNLTLYLLDKSLSGNLYIEKIIDSMHGNYIKVVESFLSKEIISLKRISLYRFESDQVKLTFRSFISLSNPDIFISQEIEKLNKDTLITSMNVPKNFKQYFARKDTLLYNPDTKIFEGNNKLFDSLVTNIVKNYNSRN